MLLVVTEKISVLKNEVRIFAGVRELYFIFSPCNRHISPKEVSKSFESITSFAPLIEIYWPWKFHKFSLNRSRENPERRGSSLGKCYHWWLIIHTFVSIRSTCSASFIELILGLFWSFSIALPVARIKFVGPQNEDHKFYKIS